MNPYQPVAKHLKMSELKELLNIMPQVGKVEWASIRPTRRGPVQYTTEVMADEASGLVGDHYSDGNRQVTLIQWEHLAAVASIMKTGRIDPALTRRNIMVSGINLLALKDQRFQIGQAVLETTGPCEPCSRMEENFGPGGYNAMQGHGGITAKVVKSGKIRVGDEVKLVISKNE